MIKIQMTKDPSKANLITHGGTFHADEVMATVVLGKLLEKITVCRVSEVPRYLKKDVIVYDIGGGSFDHHQIGGNGHRKNGVPYATSGLIWKEYGWKVLKKYGLPRIVWEKMDKILFQGIDAVDNGTMPKVDYPAYVLGLPQQISRFNPCWDSTEDSDSAFVKAVHYAEIAFDNELKTVAAKTKARRIVEEIISNTEGNIMVLDTYVSWQEALFASKSENAQNILFVIYPSNRNDGDYTWYSVPKEYKGAVPRKGVPEHWKGLEGEHLQTVTGVSGALFCHNEGFVGGAKSLEDAIAMVKIAIDS